MTIRSYKNFLVSCENTVVEVSWNIKGTGEINTLWGKEKPLCLFSKNRKWLLWRNMVVNNWIQLKDLHRMHVLVEAVLEVEYTYFQYISTFVYYFFFFQALASSAFLLDLLWGNIVVSPRLSRHRLKWYAILKGLSALLNQIFFPF